MVRKIVLSASLAAALGFTGSVAFADGEREAVFKDLERDRVEVLDRHSGLSRRAPARIRYRHRHHSIGYRHRAWDGRYGIYPRRHFFVSGVYSPWLYGPVNYSTVVYRTYVYYTPTYPSMSWGYPPYAQVYSLTPGPVYNKPCLC